MTFKHFKDEVYINLLAASRSPFLARSEVDAIDESELDEIDWSSPKAYAEGLMSAWDND